MKGLALLTVLLVLIEQLLCFPLEEEITAHSSLTRDDYEKVKQDLAQLSNLAPAHLNIGPINISTRPQTPLGIRGTGPSGRDPPTRNPKEQTSSRLLSRHDEDRSHVDSELSARWTTIPIPYTMTKDIQNDALTSGMIHKAIAFWRENTCLDWTFEDKVSGNIDHMKFFRGQGCYSMIGRVGGSQGISIGSGCTKLGVITHEIAHALGLWHEQSRPKSRRYIRIRPENIIPAFISNFLTRDNSEVIDLGVPYDLGSVMHYGPQAFANTFNVNTIETSLPGYQRTIGQRDIPAFYDVQMINRAYCASRCTTQADDVCTHGGYAHPNNCLQCICPEGLAGRNCMEPAPAKNAACGGIVLVGTGWQTINSPGYGFGGYKKDQQCNWLLRAGAGSIIELEFQDAFQLFCTATCLDFVEVKNGTDFGLTGMRFCCYSRPKTVLFSVTNEMIVLFRAYVSTDMGFKARIRAVPQGRFETKVVEKLETRSLPSIQPQPLQAQVITAQKVPATKTTVPVQLITGDERSTSVLGTIAGILERWSPKKHRIGQRSTSRIKQPNAGTAPVDRLESWTSWNSWSACSKSCGACGLRSRSRSCNSPPCVGESRQFNRCAFDTCPAKGCSQIPFRAKRRASLIVADFVSPCDSATACCSPYRPSANVCRLSTELHGVWGEWGVWGECRWSDIPGCFSDCWVRERHRVCEDQRCSGNDFESQQCSSVTMKHSDGATNLEPWP